MSKIIEKILPWGTKRRHYYQLGFTALNIIRYDGWRVFLAKAKKELAGHTIWRFSDPYQRWIKKYEPRAAALKEQPRLAAALAYRPRISLLVRTGRLDPAPAGGVNEADPGGLQATLDSVSGQTYDNWELCLAGSPPAAYSQEKRIKPLPAGVPDGEFLPQALAAATGEYIAIIDSGDELAPWALFEIVKTLDPQSGPDLLYSDEDWLAAPHRRGDPFFKPDWSPDYFLSFMYSGRLSVFRKAAVAALQGFRPQYASAMEYDLALRLVGKSGRIKHIAQVLYHRRGPPVRPPEGPQAPPCAPAYAPAEARQALTDYALNIQPAAAVEDGPWPGSFHLRRQIVGQPLVSIILPSKNKPEILKACLDSIFTKTDYSNYEIIIIDNQSSDEKLFDYYRTLEQRPGLTLLHYDRPFNYSAINNLAVSRARGEHLLLLNNDMAVITPQWMSALLEHSQRPEVGIVGAKLLYPDNTIQHCGVILGMRGICSHALSRQINLHQQGDRPDLIGNYSAVTAACLMIKKKLFDEVGGLDEALAVDYNDIDLCLKVRKLGYRIVYTPYAALYHYEALTRGYHDNPEKMRLLQKESRLTRERWGEVIARGDPYYNPNLTLERNDYSLK